MKLTGPFPIIRSNLLAAVRAGLLVTVILSTVATLRRQELSLARAMPANVSVGEIAFSSSVSDLALPVDPTIQYPSATPQIWASFEFDRFGGERMTYVLLANGRDFQWGNLDCCAGPGGRYAFPLSRPSGRPFGGAAYKLIVYADAAQVAAGGFGINGTGGFDSNDNDDEQ